MTLPTKPSPNALTARSDAFARWWDYAQQTARSLWTGEPIPAIGVYGPVLDAEEAPCLSAEATYSRFAPGDDRYTVLSFAVFARPAIMASALAVQGIVNHRRKAVARRAAVPAWRGTRDLHVILTSERLLANTSAGWISFWHDVVTEFYVDLYQRWHWLRPPTPVGQAHRPLRTGNQRLDRTPHLRRPMERSPNKRRQI
jgi:hypothetical protein